MSVQFENIPDQLKPYKQFVLWRSETVRDRATKVPYRAAPGLEKAATNDPSSWSTFEKARAELERRPYHFDGIGFVFTAQDDFVGIDLDDCRNPMSGVLSPVATEVVKMCHSYTEASPSNTGVKIFASGGRNLYLPRNRGQYRGLKVEIYNQGRYFTLTGIRLAVLRTDLQPRKQQVEQLSANLTSAEGQTPHTPRLVLQPPNPLLAPVLRRLHGVQGGPNQFTALCPAHHDTRQSLSIGIGNQGQVLLHCFAGCAWQTILNELGLQPRDLFPALPMLANRRRGGGN
jgi:putative DNA primase/helicase